MLEALLDNYNKRMNELETKITNLTLKLNELEEKINQLNKKEEKEDNNNLDNLFNNLDNLKSELEKLKQALEELKSSHEQTIIKVTNNKEQIELINEKLNDIINGYKNGDEKLQKEIDELNKKLNQINSQIDLLLKLPRNPSNSNNSNINQDLSGLNELMKKIINLENDFNAFVEKINIEEIYRQLKFLTETKADKTKVKEKFDDHQVQIDAINKRLDNLFSQMLSRKNEGGDQPVIDIDFSQYLSKTDFDKYKKEANNEFKKIWDEISNIKDLINKIFSTLKTKANISDLEELKKLLLSKLEELALACNKKFADKNETANNLKYLEDQLKKILELISTKKDTVNEADNWLIAKKPITGYSCAACESVIGNLKDDQNRFIPWNKLPLRDPGDKLYRMGNGFSKMLQMLTFDSYGNASLNTNIMHEMPNNNSNNNNDINNNSINNININNTVSKDNSTINNKRKNEFKKRINSANPKFKINFKDNKNKNLHSGYNNINNGLTKTMNKMLPDIYDISGTPNDYGPRITKVIKKNSNKQNGSFNY